MHPWVHKWCYDNRKPIWCVLWFHMSETAALTVTIIDLLPEYNSRSL